MSRLGAAVRQKRESLNLSQDEFAAAIGVKGGTIWNLENGTTQTFKKPEQLRTLKEKFGIDAAALAATPVDLPGPLDPAIVASVTAEAEARGMDPNDLLRILINGSRKIFGDQPPK